MNLKKQLACLYTYSFASTIRVAEAVWVVLLVARGFSLWQIGLAEGIFHVTSLICEIPSGAASDLMGRRRSLALSGVMGAFSALAMIAGNHYFWICLSMVFSALSYNLISGTEEAITYDSLVAAKKKDSYLKVTANMNILMTLGDVVNDLCSMLTAVLSYVGFYLIDAAISLTKIFVALRIKEPLVTEKQRARDASPFAGLGRRMKEHFLICGRFFVGNPAAAKKILADAAISVPGYLTIMFLQQRLSELGMSPMLLGLPLMGIELARMGATALGKHVRPKSVLWLYALCVPLVGAGTILSGFAPIIPAILGAMLAGAAMEVWYLHVQKSLNDSYPSDQRATLISVNSMVYSVLMIVASPITGWLGDMAGSAGVGLGVLGMGLMAAAAAAVILHWRRGRSRTVK